MLHTKKTLLKESPLMQRFWYLKYQPKEFDELAVPDVYIEQLKSIVEFPKEKLTHLLFFGPPGTGKTTTVKILVSKLVKHPTDFIQFNGSELTSEHINKIKEFAAYPARSSVSKILFLDEFDGADIEFYEQFRYILETYADRITVFATANYVYKIPKAIRDRFQLFNYNLVEFDKAKRYVLQILEREQVKYTENDIKILEDIIQSRLPDIRSIVQLVQQSTVYRKEGDKIIKELKIATIIDDSVNAKLIGKLDSILSKTRITDYDIVDIAEFVLRNQMLINMEYVLRHLIFNTLDLNVKSIILQHFDQVYRVPPDLFLVLILTEVRKLREVTIASK